MKKTMKFLSMAVLALVGAVMTSCSSDEEAPKQPANYSVTKTLTVSLGETTRALTEGGVKTFATGDKLAVIYMNEGGTMTKVETEELKAGNISLDGQTATFTVTFTEAPHEGRIPLTYIYPASIATSDGYVDNSQLSTQDGTLTSLASNLDACRGYDPEWRSSGNLPALTLTNAFTIGKFIIKNPSGTAINDDLTSVTISDGSNTYTITPTGSTFTSDPIWVAMQPVYAGSTVTVTATDGTNNYSKSITIAEDKDLLAGKIYPINVTMYKVVNLATLADDYTAQNGDMLTGTLAAKHQISIADGATVTLDNASINAAGTWKGGNYAGITCLGNATIILSGTNTVKGFYENYPGIFVPSSKTLIIQGTGSLTASSNGYGAGIGGGFNINCGNIEIQGGVITATGGRSAAGIGGGSSASCGTITINNTVTSVTATKGEYATNSIGAGNGGTCGTVTIGGVVGAITTSPYTYPAPSGALAGKFSVSSTKQVYFSKGNLQAVGTTSSSPTSGWTWQFAEHQYDYIGGCSFGGSEPQTGNNYISGNGTLSANGTVDLFGWSTNATYYGIHDSDDASDYSGTFQDWGNVIGTGWRTLTKDEWFWVLGPLVEDPDPGTNCRTSSTVNGVENARYAGARVAGKAGLIIFPDSYTHPGDVDAPESESVNAAGAAYDSNSYNATEWGKMEAAGAVFLPAAGFRPAGNIVQECEVSGYYWCSVLSYSETAYSLTFQEYIVFPWGINYINQGCSVRLVKDAN